MQLDIKATHPKSILTATGGFLKGYSHSLNPYTGCAFACSYCYVRKLPVSIFRSQPWGTWVDMKQGAAELLRKELIRAKKKGPVTIFMSSSTDPYQPVEYEARITRSLLEVMTEEKPDFLFIQTRSPLVTRDMDLFLQLQDRIRISVTIETDLEAVRKQFTPSAPPIAARYRALHQLTEAGLPTQATVAPVLPSSEAFGAWLSKAADRVCVDDYFMGDGNQGKRTKALGISKLYSEDQLGWYDPEAYLRVIATLKPYFDEDHILVSEQGFAPTL
ncbi:SPL family radical SAM protein [Paenibacillus terrigena]|uniref:SPL family radical SAM protein n=1 Tax=Paenibacillus terrigena TaxID=369333 RepID=UPI0003A4F116|nr:radical SAM protein [Paenibacillus terrigena]